MTQRNYTFADQLIEQIDQGLRTVFGRPPGTTRANPSDGIEETELSDTERLEAARLMRVNHAGEVSAQALYQGQAMTARQTNVRDAMQQAASEENDHLRWCRQRIDELGEHTSYLNPVWYLGSLTIGAVAGLAGDKWSLGFVAETERQVVRHLDKHLVRLPEADLRSRAILEQMKSDETHHGTVALESGGAELPEPVRMIMDSVSKVMTRTAYWV